MPAGSLFLIFFITARIFNEYPMKKDWGQTYVEYRKLNTLV